MSDDYFICCACGTQFAKTSQPPASCVICQDARQFVPKSGQQWTTLERLARSHSNIFREQEPHLLGIGTNPPFAIGQRALLLRTPGGNILWDCISLIDDATVEIIKGLGGLKAIAISHPHYYTTVVEWSRAFGGTKIYLHVRDREWVMRPDPSIEFWDGETREIVPGATLICCGGHFPGGTVLHWRDGADGRGVLLSGDVLQVTPDGFVSVMFSYPNYLPLAAADVKEIARRLEPWAYDRIYGAFWDRCIDRDAKSTVASSISRYLRAIGASEA